jgi:signal transduction histidine kinase/ActR/RegA family two-component response regulator
VIAPVVEFFTSKDLLPHATCLSWRADLLWLHASSDVLTALAYYSIPLALTWFALRRRDLRFRWMFLLFGVFILACGTTHLMSVWTLWVPDWGIAGIVKALTAMASVATAVLLWPLLPKALAIRGPDEWQRVNAEVTRLNAELENRVLQRTAELESANQSLREEIARRNRIESDLRAATAEAERANRAKTRFLAAASHDLRQPVQSLFWFYGALEEKVRGTDLRKILDGMDQSLAGLKVLLDSLLDASKLDAGIIVPEPQKVAIGPLLARLATEYAPAAARTGLDLRVAPSTAVVVSDPALLERIVRNLIENALRYTHRGGIVLGARRHRGRLRLVVADTGIGIPADKQAEVFEEFVQVGNPERDRTKGLGLGLAIVRRLAGLLGHQVGLTSTAGRGSCFYVELECTGSRPPEPKNRPTATPTTHSRVLVIEDEALVRQGLCAMLQSWGYDALGAESGQEALAALDAAHPPELILADYRLKNEELGPDAIAKVIAKLGRAVPAIIITGDTAPERIREAKAQQFRLLHKPIAANDLRLMIGALAAGEVL